jgi:hypothetical protein
MTDHIKRSLEIQAFLDREKITVEPDEFALVVVHWTKEEPPFYQVCTKQHADRYFYKEIVCFFYGPGGADNSLKALRAWVKKQMEARLDIGEKHAFITAWHEKRKRLVGYHGEGKTDGIALADLLEKLMEETKDES